MRRQAVRGIGLLCLILLSAACACSLGDRLLFEGESPAAPAPAVEPEAEEPPDRPRGNDKLIRQIDEAEALWLDQGVTSYYIEVSHVRSIWHAQTQQITVRAGEVVETSAFCVAAPFETEGCEVEPFEAEEYTVPGLFDRARDLSQADPEQVQWLEITFDPTYGFPSRIAFDDPEIVDEDWALGVRTFEVLE